jgi:hypothetical protein
MAMSILVLLAGGAVQAAEPPRPPAPLVRPDLRPGAVVRLGCSIPLQHADGARAPALRLDERLVGDRSGRFWTGTADDEVRLVYLLERTVDGCPVPLVSATRLQEAERAVGRDLAAPRR